MANEAFFIPDGYTMAATIEARPGVHPKAEVTYRPALMDEYNSWRAEAATGDAKRKTKKDAELIRAHVISLNGEPLPQDKIAKLKPQFVERLTDLILGYVGSDEAADLKN